MNLSRHSELSLSASGGSDEGVERDGILAEPVKRFLDFARNNKTVGIKSSSSRLSKAVISKDGKAQSSLC